MRLIIGGYAQGKLEYVIKNYIGNNENYIIIDENSFNQNYLCSNDQTVIINKLNLCVKNLITMEHLKEDISFDLVKRIYKIMDYKDIIIICDEIGNGVVPIDKTEHVYRETVGRLLVDIADKSESVERIICGLPQRLK